MPIHHLPDELLLDHAAGSLPEPVALLVATHLAMCPACRESEARLEAVGGALLDEITPEPIEGGGVDALFARIEAGTPEASDAKDAAVEAAKPDSSDVVPALPRPLRDYVAGASTPWTGAAGAGCPRRGCFRAGVAAPSSFCASLPGR